MYSTPASGRQSEIHSATPECGEVLVAQSQRGVSKTFMFHEKGQQRSDEATTSTISGLTLWRGLCIQSNASRFFLLLFFFFFIFKSALQTGRGCRFQTIESRRACRTPPLILNNSPVDFVYLTLPSSPLSACAQRINITRYRNRKIFRGFALHPSSD